MKRLNRTKLIGGALVLAGAMLINTAPAMAQDYGNPDGNNYAPPVNLNGADINGLVSRIALYPDPLLAQIFAAAAFPDQVVAAAQGSGGPFDPSVEALLQYPSVLQMMASDPGWTEALGQAVMQDEGSVMDSIQNLRREAQNYGYLQNSPQMQVVNDGGYIDIMPVSGYMYVPVYDPYVVFARPRAGFFVGGAIRFGGGFNWVSGYNRFDWRRHQVFVNRQVWTPPVRRSYVSNQRAFPQQRFEGNRTGFTGGNREWNRNYSAPAVQTPTQRGFVQQQPRRDGASHMQQRNFTAQPQVQQRNFAAQPQVQQRNFAVQPQRNTPAPRQMEQRNFTPQPGNQGRFGHGEGRGHGR